jgi:hypothetical protein
MQLKEFILIKNKIDIRDMINSFSVLAEIIFDNCSIIHFPDHTHKFKKFSSALIEKVDVFFMHVDRDDKRSFHNLNYLCNYSSTPVFIIVDEDYAEEFKMIHSSMRNNILVITSEQIDGILKDLSGEEIEGYEIHMGISSLHEEFVSMTSIINQIDGETKPDGAFCNNVYGTYIHGIFDKNNTAERLIHCLAKEKNLDMGTVTSMDYAQYKETQYDLLADTLRKYLDMSKIYEILNNSSNNDTD